MRAICEDRRADNLYTEEIVSNQQVQATLDSAPDLRRSAKRIAERTMKSIAFISFMLTVTMGCTSLRPSRGMAQLRHDGLYRSVEMRRASGGSCFWSYLRFYPDGLVIVVSTSGSPNTIRPWFNRKHDHSSRGKVSVEGTAIAFDSVSQYGTVHYRGEITADHIRLEHHSEINGRRGCTTYQFMEWQAEQDVGEATSKTAPSAVPEASQR